MADGTHIEWTDSTWNPVVGCSVVSLGCTNCYAMKMAARIERMNPGSHYDGTTKPSKAGAVWTGKLALAPDHILTAPLRWRRPRRIFVNSMSDLFHEKVPDEWIDQVFAVMAMVPQHVFQVLTKRSARMRAYIMSRSLPGPGDDPEPAVAIRLEMTGHHAPPAKWAQRIAWPLPNVWLGISCEDQRRADERIPDLLATPAVVQFVSAEPLLEPIHFIFRPEWMINGLDWIIVGGESGPGARPMHPQWARDIRDQCAAAGVAFFVKQMSGVHGKIVKDISAFPEDLRFREMPHAR